MKLPRDLSGDERAQALAVLGYSPSRQTGSHVRLITIVEGEHHVTIPRHRALRVGTFGQLLTEVATHFRITRTHLIERPFGGQS
ncbi:MAG: type II toxin-antitoxin system HicA family toxin [Candidatus Schekmanbacteria bacterium]|nr:type II toxin-antitoxin system HicA family toxin [Candidatus Schekmanbacteria bacterium]